MALEEIKNRDQNKFKHEYSPGFPILGSCLDWINKFLYNYLQLNPHIHGFQYDTLELKAIDIVQISHYRVTPGSD